MKTLFSFVFLFTSSISLACPLNSETQCFSEMKSANIKLTPPNIMASSTVTLAEYNSIFDKIRRIYTPIFAQSGFELLLESDWNDGTLQAFSTAKIKNPHRRKVYVSGGYARKNLQSKETLLTTICHEIGHHLGGYPQMSGQSWPASAEGQADYYATSKCMKLVLQDEVALNKQIAESADVPEFVKDECSKQFSTSDEQNLCIRLAVASEKQGQSFMSETMASFIHLDNMDTSKVDSIDYTHPRASCRMTTLYQGALCNLNPRTAFSINEELTGGCHAKNGHQLGVRPLCWFLPKE